MSENQLKKQVLIDQMGYLCEELGDPGRYFPYLKAKGLLDQDDCEKIRTGVTSRAKTETFIETISRGRQSSKGEHPFDVLLDALNKQRVQAHIARHLQRCLARHKKEKGVQERQTPEIDDSHFALFKKYMQEGYVVCHIHTLMMIGVAGAGKTSFLHLVLKKPPPAIRVSTPLATNAIRALSISHAAVTRGKSTITWHAISPESFLAWLAEGMKGRASFLLTEPIFPSIQKPMPLASLALGDNTQESTPMAHFDYPSSDLFSGDLSVATKNIKLTKRLIRKKCVHKLIENIKASTGDAKKFDDHWMYLVDTGGQPQFHELLPTFVQNVSGAIIFVKLNEPLDGVPEIAYYSEGGHLSGTPYSSTLTHMETIQNCLQVLQSRRNLQGEIECPKLFCIGTHKDLAWSCEENIDTKNKRLLEMFRTHTKLKENLAYYRSVKPEELMYIVNSKNPKVQDHSVAEQFRRAVMSQCAVFKVKIPVRWFILEQLLLQLAIDKKSSVLSLEDCLKEANDLEMNSDDLQAALNYLVRINIFKYFPDLPNVIFTTAQVFLDKISELVEYSHYLRGELGSTHAAGDACDSESVKFRDYGLLTAEFLQKKFPKHYIEGLFTSQDLLKVLMNKLVFAHKGDQNYFMPCVLRSLPSSELSSHRSDHKSPVPPLLVYCPSGLFPCGNFNGLIAFLQNKSAWKIAEEYNLPQCLYKNCVKFRLRDRPELITLVYSYDYIEVHAKIPAKLCPRSCPTIACIILKGLTAAAKVQSCEHLQHQFAFFCSCKNSSNSPHLASVDSSRQWCSCSRSDDYSSNLTEMQKLWFKAPSLSAMDSMDSHGSDVRPQAFRAPKLEQSQVSRTPMLADAFKMLLPLAYEWPNIAVLLGVAHENIKVIQQENVGVHNGLRAMLSQWLNQVNPKPTWSSLAEAVELLGNQAQAKEIRRMYPQDRYTTVTRQGTLGGQNVTFLETLV